MVPGETKEQFYNASGAYWDPGFLLAAGVEWENHAFVGWQDEDGNTYGAGEEAELAKDMVFTAVWDQYPSIAAKDRYFTLRQAVRGEITEQALLERVTATDPEDGILENGERVRVLDYRESDYTGLTGEAKLAVTYEAVDSFGSRVTAQVTVHIVDTAPREREGVSYVRFISGDFYRVGGEYVPTQAGGLLETSIWRTDEAYRIVLERALLKQALLRQALREHLSDTAEIKIPEETRAQAVIEHMEGAETWTFTREQVQEVKRFVLENGFGKYLNVNGIERFYRQFGACR